MQQITGQVPVTGHVPVCPCHGQPMTGGPARGWCPQRRLFALVRAGTADVDELVDVLGCAETYTCALLRSLADAGLLVRVDGAWRCVVDAPLGFVVKCSGCWFPGGAPLASEVAATDVAARHDAAAHDGIPTAQVTPRWESWGFVAGVSAPDVPAMTSGTGVHR